MKGVIVRCLEEYMTENHGREKWEDALETAGLDRHFSFVITQDIDDAKVLKVIESVCQVLGISLAQAADAFGEHWVTVFAPKMYGAYYKGVTSAKDFLLKMDQVHKATTRSVPNARPPRFDYEWQDDKTLIMKYKSDRGLIDILVGLVKGVGTHFGEQLAVTKKDSETLQIGFGG